MYTGYQETLLYQSAALVIGSFRCAPWYPGFEDAGSIDQGHTIVFPRTGVIIAHEGRRPFLADPNQAVFYNLSHPYRRRKFSELGDNCEFFAFAPSLLLPALQPYDPAASERHDRPFDFSHGPTDAATYLVQRRLVERLRREPGADDPLYVEETGLEILDRTLALAFRARRGYTRTSGVHPNTRLLHRDLVHQARAVLNARFAGPLSLQDVARELYVSPYHLCRIFRRETGSTLHQYLEQVRLRVALDYVLPGGHDLSSVAHALGFSSHSHFTQSMRRAYGLPPTALRDSVSASPAT